MTEQLLDAGGITLCHESFGDPADPPLLLVMGLGGPMIWWDDEFCVQLAEAGFHVHRYDNRDVGRSQWWTGRVSLPLALLLRSAPYSLGDLGDDAANLLDALDVERAHVVGTSMGGMIAQELAIRHPHRVRSLTSIMSTTGGRTVGQPSLRAARAMMARGPRTREEYITQLVRTSRVLSSPDYPVDDEYFRLRAERTYDRGHHPAGVLRQLAAIVSARDRTADLRRLSVPSLVIHGAADPLVHVSGGRATARALGADLDVVPGMGHELPRQVWSRASAGIRRIADVTR
jgi:pimeloyl-ACP methyl ester carboxylesterase